MTDNQGIKDRAHAMELEGAESGELAQQVVDFVDEKNAEFNTALATAQAKIDELTATQLPDADRDEITTALDGAKTASDAMQGVLRALVTPPEEPLPVEAAKNRTRRR